MKISALCVTLSITIISGVLSLPIHAVSYEVKMHPDQMLDFGILTNDETLIRSALTTLIGPKIFGENVRLTDDQRQLLVENLKKYVRTWPRAINNRIFFELFLFPLLRTTETNTNMKVNLEANIEFLNNLKSDLDIQKSNLALELIQLIKGQAQDRLNNLKPIL